MDGWLKALIAAACVVIIAAGGYYSIKENADATQRVADEKERRTEEACAFAKRNKGLLPELHKDCEDRGY